MVSESNKNAAETARVGRPRANQTRPEGLVRDEILTAARALFREKGFKGTSTREIAEQAGLKQPSLFHYFKTKGDIFREVALGSVQPVMAFIAREETLSHPPETAFYRLVYFDTFHLCTNENALGSPFQFPELTRDMQPEFWQLRDSIVSHYGRLLEAGKKAGAFDVADVDLVTQLVFALGESTLTWYRRGESFQPEHVADVTATLALRSVLKDTARIQQVVMQAKEDQIT